MPASVSDPSPAARHAGGRHAPVSGLRLSWAFLRRDFRAGELHLLLLALVVAVSAIATASFFVDRLNQALQAQATRLLGGDLVIRTDRPIPPEWQRQAEVHGLQVASSIGFPSMAIAGEVPADGSPGGDEGLPPAQLASILAVSPHYPLRGALTVSGETVAGETPGDGHRRPVDERAASMPSAGIGQGGAGGMHGEGRPERQLVPPSAQRDAEALSDRQDVHQAPERGTVFVDQALAQALGLGLGDVLTLGDASFRISRYILMEQSRGASFVNFAPRLILSQQDLPGTGLIGPGSRLSYRMLLAGEREAVEDFRQWLEPRLGAGQHLETIDSGRPELQATLERARQFLALVSLLSVLIAAVAIGLAARRFAQRHLDGFAILKAMGMTQRRLVQVLLLEMGWLALAAGLLGVLLGWLAHHGLVHLASLLVDAELPPPSWRPAGQALLVAVVLILGFAALPVLRLAGVPPLRVLRRDLGGPGLPVWLVLVVGILCFGLLLFWLVDEPRLAALSLGGFAVSAVIFVLLALLAVRLSAWMRPRRARGDLGLAWRLALTGWRRRQAVSIIQIVALTVGLMALLLLSIVRNDLLSTWQRAVPADAPNRFVLNIQPGQQAGFLRILDEAGIRQVQLHPMVRGRLVAINDRPVGVDDFSSDRARRLLDREFNLSHASELPAQNVVAQGRWLDPAAAEVSAEVGVMQTLGLNIGDRLRFDIGGQVVDMRLVGSRRLKWDSMQVNFFMIGSPAALSAQPQSLITAFHLAAGQEPVVRRLLAAMPNLTVVDTGIITAQLQSMVGQVIRAVQFLFLFTLLAGGIVLYAAMGSVRDEQVAEMALMRALGASRRQLAWAHLLELALVGLLSGLMAAGAAWLLGQLLARQVFDLSYQPAAWLLLTGVAGSVLFVVLAGGWGIRRLLDTPPLQALRAG